MASPVFRKLVKDFLSSVNGTFSILGTLGELVVYCFAALGRTL